MKNSLGGNDMLERLAGMAGGAAAPGGGGGGIADALSGMLGGAKGSGGSGLGDMLSGVLGGGGQQAGASGGLGGLLSGMLGGAGQAVGGKQNLAVGGLGALVGALLGGGGKSLGGAVGGGLMALLGAMAFNALKGSGQNPTAMPLGLLEPQTQDEQRQLEQGSELVLRAMINAAKSDGQVDANEMNRMMGKFEEAGLDAQSRNYLMARLREPMETRELVNAAKGQPQLAAQLYAASLLAIEVDTPAEKQYLDELARALGLEASVTGQIQQFVGLQQA